VATRGPHWQGRPCWQPHWQATGWAGAAIWQPQVQAAPTQSVQEQVLASVFMVVSPGLAGLIGLRAVCEGRPA
jgi:hypothetical protein